MKVVLWPYRFDDAKISWRSQYQWVVLALQELGHEVLRHPRFICEGLEQLSLYRPERDNPCDVVIYNHATMAELVGNVCKCRQAWFLKPTVPDEVQTTLDPVGYGPYSSICYNKPPFMDEPLDVEGFFANEVAGWLKDRPNKWKAEFAVEKAPCEDFHLVVGQCGGDSVVTRMHFGSYFTELLQVVAELVRVDRREIVVKLHPYTDGRDAKDDKFSRKLARDLASINGRVHVVKGKTSVHNYVAACRDVILANSGTGFEAMMHHKPIISWGCPEYHWITHDLRHLAHLRRALSLDWFNVTASDRFLTWYYTRYAFHNGPSAKRRVEQLLEGVSHG